MPSTRMTAVAAKCFFIPLTNSLKLEPLLSWLLLSYRHDISKPQSFSNRWIMTLP